MARRRHRTSFSIPPPPRRVPRGRSPRPETGASIWSCSSLVSGLIGFDGNPAIVSWLEPAVARFPRAAAGRETPHRSLVARRAAPAAPNHPPRVVAAAVAFVAAIVDVAAE